MTYVIVKQYESQQPPLSAEQIARNYKLPIRLVNQIITNLVAVSVLMEVVLESSKTKNYAPAIDINQLTVKQVFLKLETFGAESFLSSKNKQLDSFWQKTIDMKQRSEESNAQLLVKDL